MAQQSATTVVDVLDDTVAVEDSARLGLDGTGDEVDSGCEHATALRRWARSNGYDVFERARTPTAVREAFDAACWHPSHTPGPPGGDQPDDVVGGARASGSARSAGARPSAGLGNGREWFIVAQRLSGRDPHPHRGCPCSLPAPDLWWQHR